MCCVFWTDCLDWSAMKASFLTIHPVWERKRPVRQPSVCVIGTPSVASTLPVADSKGGGGGGALQLAASEGGRRLTRQSRFSSILAPLSAPHSWEESSESLSLLSHHHGASARIGIGLEACIDAARPPPPPQALIIPAFFAQLHIMHEGDAGKIFVMLLIQADCISLFLFLPSARRRRRQNGQCSVHFPRSLFLMPLSGDYHTLTVMTMTLGRKHQYRFWRSIVTIHLTCQDNSYL